MTLTFTGFGESPNGCTLISGIPALLAIGVLALILLALARRALHATTRKRLEVQFIHRAQTLAFLSEYFASQQVKVLDVDFRAENHPDGKRYTNVYMLSMPHHTSCADIVGALCENPNILNVVARDA